MESDSEGKGKKYFELLAERDLLDRDLAQARARESEAVLREIAQKMWLFEFSPRDVEKAYRKYELVHGNAKVANDGRIRKMPPMTKGFLEAEGYSGEESNDIGTQKRGIRK